MRKLITTIAMLIVTASLFAATWTVPALNNGQTKFIFKETFLGRVYIADAETKKEIPLTIDETTAVVTDVSKFVTNLFNNEAWVKSQSVSTIEDIQKDAHFNLRLAKQNAKTALKEEIKSIENQ